ncbi:UNVERIFIED_CONTAM: Phf21a [Trichonephila clavipes]
MDLQTISSQMKVVIQKHQIVVTEMRNDPQNPVLQKRLNDLKLEIQTLNERQASKISLISTSYFLRKMIYFSSYD